MLLVVPVVDDDVVLGSILLTAAVVAALSAALLLLPISLNFSLPVGCNVVVSFCCCGFVVCSVDVVLSGLTCADCCCVDVLRCCCDDCNCRA